MYYDELKKVLIKKNKVQNSENNWGDIEEKLKLTLPCDYKWFIDFYGTGGINSFFWILSPFCDVDHINLIERGKTMLDSYKHLKNKYPDYYKHEVYPYPNGILPLGYTDNGDEVFWKTAEKTENWTIVVYESRSDDYIEYDMGIVTFIYNLVTKKIVCDIFPNEFIGEENSYDV